MSWAITAVAVIAGGAAHQAYEENKARQEAKEQAKKDRANNLRAEQFAETEGEGQGMIGTINLAVDDEVDSDLLSGKSNISI